MFLQYVRQDDKSAETQFQRAIENEPKHATHFARYAGFLFAHGRLEEGFRLADQAAELDPDPDDRLELAFYRYAHGPNDASRQASLAEAKGLLADDVRVSDWSPQRNVQEAIGHGHPDPEFLGKLANVIAGDGPPTDLAVYAEWNGA